MEDITDHLRDWDSEKGAPKNSLILKGVLGMADWNLMHIGLFWEEMGWELFAKGTRSLRIVVLEDGVFQCSRKGEY